MSFALSPIIYKTIRSTRESSASGCGDGEKFHCSPREGASAFTEPLVIRFSSTLWQENSRVKGTARRSRSTGIAHRERQTLVSFSAPSSNFARQSDASRSSCFFRMSLAKKYRTSADRPRANPGRRREKEPRYTTGIHGTSIVSRRKAIIGPNGPCGSSKVAQCSVKASRPIISPRSSCKLTVMERNDIHRPPKSLRNDLNKRPGKVPAFGGIPGACCANGHCEPPCIWHAAFGTLSTGKSMS